MLFIIRILAGFLVSNMTNQDTGAFLYLVGS